MRLHDAAANRLRGTSRGRRAFTLIELLVVILIVAILVAVALTSFLGQTTKAQDSGVKQHLTVARIEAKAYWTSQGQSGFAPAGTDPTTATSTVVAALNASEPGYDFVPDPFMVSPAGNTPTTSTSTIGVAVNPDDANEITFCQEAPDGTVFCLRTDETGQLIAIPGYDDTAASAANPIQSLVAPVSANADPSPTTDVVRATGTGSTPSQAEANALCVLQAATPTVDGGTGMGDPSSCAPGGYAGWSTDPNGGGTTTSGSGSDGGAIPADTTAPSVTGGALTGSVLTGSPGVWSGDPFIYSYEWEDCSTSAGTTCTPISGAVGPTYTLKASDIGSYVFLDVAATNSTGTSGYTQSWDSIGPVIGGAPAGGQPTITGTPWIGDQLSGSPGSWSNSPSSYSYQWESCTDELAQNCTPVPGTAGQQSTYTLAAGDSGDYLVLQVTATNSDGTSSAATSNILGPVIGIPTDGTPTISGDAWIGSALTGAAGAWSSPLSSYAYQWEDCTTSSETSCTAISGASGTASGGSMVSYTVQSSDSGKFIALVITPKDNAGTGSAATSTATSAVIGAPANTALPSISGTTFMGDSLAVTTGTWAYSPTLSYQWEDCTGADGSTGTGCIPISGATESSYTLTETDQGYYIVVAVTGTNAAGSSTVSASPVGVVVQGITTVAGTGTAGYTGNGGAATSAELNNIHGIAVDSAGDIFITDVTDCVIREVNHSTGVISTVAGNGTCGYSGDGGLATSAELDDPDRAMVDSSGNLFIADTGNNRVREVSAVTGKITTIAGNGTAGYSGDGGQATGASLDQPYGMVESGGYLYIADYGNDVVRRVNLSSGIISTVAGIAGSPGDAGAGGPATNAQINAPTDLAVDASGNIYINNDINNVIDRVNPSTGTLTVFAGTATAGYTGDDGRATSAELDEPKSMAFDSAGDMFFADDGNSVIREITPSGIISTVAGNGVAGDGSNGQATASELNSPVGIGIDGSGNLYLADTGNNIIRKITL